MAKELTEEMFAGNFIEELPRKRIPAKGRPNGTLIRYVLLECLHCRNPFERTLANAKRIQQKCCSVACHMRLTEKIVGGNEQHPIYPRWLAMRQRIYNPTDCNYKNYGGRGITIEDGLDDFVTYANFVTSLPNYNEKNLENIQLDRIENNSNYKIGNLRWATRSTQVANQRHITKGFNTYRGVGWSNAHKKWIARVNYEGKTYCSSTHLTEEAALAARNKCIEEHNLPHPIQKYTS